MSDKEPTRWERFKKAASTISVEPVMLLDGLGYENMAILAFNLQMDKICLNSLGESEEVCHNLTDHTDVERAMSKEASVFRMYNGITLSLIPLFFILFMGAWSDKYGRKVPLVISLIGHLLYDFIYLVNSLFIDWPVELLLLAPLFGSLGGGFATFMSTANSYISDVTSKESRTRRIGLANGLFFLFCPVGTLMGKFLFEYGGYIWVFGTSVAIDIVNILYILLYLPESHGPFSNKARMEKIIPGKPSTRFRESLAWIHAPFSEGPREGPEETSIRHKNSSELHRKDITLRMMVIDFFNPKRLIESIKCTFRPREGHIRMYVILLLFSSVLIVIGNGAFFFLFSRVVLHWNSSDYGLWLTYKMFICSIGCLIAVPLLTTKLQVSDKVLAIIGGMSGIAEYIFYGLCINEETEFFFWIGPAASLLVKCCPIAVRAMLSKYINADELGKVSAVLGGFNRLAKMMNDALYTAVFRASVDVFPGGQFFFGASLNLLMIAIFILIMCTDRTDENKIDTALSSKPKGLVQLMRRESTAKNLSYSTILLSSINMTIEIPEFKKVLHAPLELNHIILGLNKEMPKEENTEEMNMQKQHKEKPKEENTEEMNMQNNQQRQNNSQQNAHTNDAFVEDI